MRVALHGITKKYGRTRALDNVTVEFQPGQIIAVIGVNGAGKTTLLRALAGILSLDRGRLEFDGENFLRERLDQRRKLWFLPDFPPLFPNESALENLSLILRLFEADSPEVDERALALLTEFDLIGLAEAPLSTLSRGQIYKTALTALICVDPELWLLDEPFASGMDPIGIAAFRREARAAANRGHTVVYSTQWLEPVQSLSDRLCILSHGQLRAFGPLGELQEQTGTSGQEIEELFRKFSQAPS